MFSKVSTGIAVSLLMLAGTIGTSHGQQKPVGGPNPSPPGAAVYFVGLKDGQTRTDHLHREFRPQGHGRRARRLGQGERRTPPFADRHRAAAARSADSERLQSSAFRRGANRGRSDLAGRRAHAAAGARRQEPHSEYDSADLRADQGSRGCRRAGARGVGSLPAAPATTSPASAGRKKSPDGAKVYFVFPKNRGYVTPTPVIRFGLIGMGVAPAGFEKVNTGHHHLLIDTEMPTSRPADPERLQPSAFRRRPDRSQDHAAARQAYAAIAAGRRDSTSRTIRRCCRNRSRSRSPPAAVRLQRRSIANIVAITKRGAVPEPDMSTRRPIWIAALYSSCC